MELGRLRVGYPARLQVKSGKFPDTPTDDAPAKLAPTNLHRIGVGTWPKEDRRARPISSGSGPLLGRRIALMGAVQSKLAEELAAMGATIVAGVGKTVIDLIIVGSEPPFTLGERRSRNFEIASEAAESGQGIRIWGRRVSESSRRRQGRDLPSRLSSYSLSRQRQHPLLRSQVMTASSASATFAGDPRSRLRWAPEQAGRRSRFLPPW